jgi:quinol monooxygenase YgiN
MPRLFMLLAASIVGSVIGATAQERPLRYGLSGKMTVQPGHRDAVVAVLLRDVKELKAVGCDLYVVSVLPDQPDAIWVTEVWTSRDAHHASLALPTVQRAISEVKPLITGMSDRTEVAVVGGLGVPD